MSRKWFEPQVLLPENNSENWIRLRWYSGSPVRAIYVESVQEFISIDSGLIIPAYSVERFSPVPSKPLFIDSYPQFSSAYGLVKLYSDYSGFCCQVKRVSDWNVINVGFLNNVVDLDAILDFSGGSDVIISKLYDQSANGYDLEEEINNQGPYIYKDLDFYIFNDLPYFFNNNQFRNLRFQGLDSFKLSDYYGWLMVYTRILGQNGFVGGVWNNDLGAGVISHVSPNLRFFKSSSGGSTNRLLSQNSNIIGFKNSNVLTEWSGSINDTYISSLGQNIGSNTPNAICIGGRHMFNNRASSYFNSFVFSYDLSNVDLVAASSTLNEFVNVY